VSGRPDFGGARARGAVGGALRSMVFLLMVIGGLLVWTAGSEPSTIEISGVPVPGSYSLTRPTIHAVVAAAGGDASGLPDATLADGTRLVVGQGTVTLTRIGGASGASRAPARAVFELPLDPNRATAEALAALPGVDEVTATAIIAERDASGPYRSLDGLRRVGGLDEGDLERLRPFLALEQPESAVTQE